MSNIEKIRQEIERRKKICEGIFERESDTYYQGKAVAYGELLPFIDSLPEEKPSEDLEEAAKEYMKKARKHLFDDSPIGRTDDAFIAGAEWQKKQMMDEWLKDRDGCFWDGVEEGKKAMEEQMMKDAVEREVVQDLKGRFHVKTNAVSDILYQFGDKVKVIILPKK